MYLDTHCHYDLRHFNEDRFALLALLKQETGIEQIIVPAVLAESNQTMRQKLDVSRHPELLEGTGITPEQLPQIFYAAGVHPTRVWAPSEGSEDQWEGWIRDAAQQPDTVAIGETGLDYHHPMDEDMYAKQHRWFQRQLTIAEDCDLPLILHIRMADDDALRILRQHPLNRGGVVHCYCEGVEIAKQYLDLGLMFGIGGAVSLPKMGALREAVKWLPLDRLLLETDAPYVKPIWELDAEARAEATGDAARWAAWGASRDDAAWAKWANHNTSRNIPYFAAIIAELKGLPVEAVVEQTTENAKTLFHMERTGV